MNFLARFSALLIAVALARVPMPWAHDHALLTAEALALHVATHHAGCNDCELPQGLHVHVDLVEAVVEGTQLPDVTPSGAAARLAFIDNGLTLGAVAVSLAGGDSSSGDDVRAGRCVAPSAGSDLFLQYGSLRI